MEEELMTIFGFEYTMHWFRQRSIIIKRKIVIDMNYKVEV